MFQSYYKQQILTSRYVTATRFSQRAVTACRSLTRSSAYYHKSSFKKLAAKGRTQQGIKPNVKLPSGITSLFSDNEKQGFTTQQQNISNEEVVRQVRTEAGINDDRKAQQATEESVKLLQ